MKKYKIKNNGRFIYNKMTVKQANDFKIKWITWQSAISVEENEASTFDKEELQWMKDNYGNLEVIEVANKKNI